MREADENLSISRIRTKSAQSKIIRQQTYRPSWLSRPLINNKSPTSVSILMLNDDCLRAIFEQSVIGFDELAKLSYVCKRFNNILAEVSRNKPAEAKPKLQNKSIWKTNAILTALGSTIQYASVFSKSEVIPDMLMQRCPHLLQFSACYRKPHVTYILEQKRGYTAPMRFERYSQHLNMNKCVIPAKLPKMLYTERPPVVQLNLFGIRSINLRSYFAFVDGNKQLKQVNFSKVTHFITQYAGFFIGCFPNEIEKLTYNCKSRHDATLLIKQYSDKPSAFRSRTTDDLVLPHPQPTFIYHLKYLKYLRTNQLGDVQMLKIAKDLKELEEIFIASKDITYAGIYDVVNEAKNLKIVSITTTHNDYTEANLARISALRQRRGLQLDVNAYRSMSNTVRRILKNLHFSCLFAIHGLDCWLTIYFVYYFFFPLALCDSGEVEFKRKIMKRSINCFNFSFSSNRIWKCFR